MRLRVAEFGHLGQQGGGGDRADAGDALEPGGAGLQGGCRLHGAGDLGVEPRQAARQEGQMDIDVGPDVRGGLAAPVLLGPPRAQELPTPGDQRAQVPRGRLGARAHGRLDGGGEAREHLGIQRVGLGQDAVGAGEVAHLAWVDHRDRQARRLQRRHHRLLIAAAGLQHEAPTPLRAHPPAQGGVAGRSVRHPPGSPGRVDGHIQVIPGDIDAEIQVRSGSHSVPSTRADLAPCLADSGSRLRPRQLFGLWASATGRDDPALPRSRKGPRANRSVPARRMPSDVPRVLGTYPPWHIQGLG